MKKKATELVFILDKSGSMCGLEADTIGGYNAMLKEQKAVVGECHITTVLFDDRYELLHDRMDINAVHPISAAEYQVGGSTALLDAIGKTIHTIRQAQKQTKAEQKAEKVMFVIITDGEENSSREYSADKVKQLIERQKEKHGWEFIFLGANIDAVKTAQTFGIAPDHAQNFCADAESVTLNYQVMSEAITSVRMCNALPTDWGDKISNHFKTRGQK